MKAFLSSITVMFMLGLVLTASPTIAQQSPSEKFKHAIARSEDAARVLSLLVTSDSGFPKNLVDEAEIIAVFPRASRQDAFVRRLLQGYGVISARHGNGWSLPAFYQFVSAPRKFSGSSQETLAVILVFLSKDAGSRFADRKSKFKGDMAASLGPVGILTEAERTQLGAKIAAYTYYNGKLNANNIDPDFFRDFILDQDNNINVPLYGIKAHEVLAGKKIDPASLPSGISAFQENLVKYWPTR